jgi:hypothetical protein
MGITPVPASDLQRVWKDNRMDEKRATGELVEAIVRRGPATNRKYIGGESRIIKLITPERRRHVGTIHEIVVAEGSIPHSHPKDYTRRDCSRIRAPEPGETL